MRIITYLAFTVLSIVFQFCVMDFIQKTQPDKPLDLNLTSPKKRLNDILKEFNHKPHALYYRTNISKLLKKSNSLQSKRLYRNSSSQEISVETTTDLSSTAYNLLYDDENTSVTDDTITTEFLFTTTEFDNVTEITFFDKKNNTPIKPFILPKRTMKKDCNCNLLYKACDINCCCDNECTEAERAMFHCPKHENSNEIEHLCYPHDTYFSKIGDSLSDGLFCIAKTNLPDKRNVNRYNLEKNDASINMYFKWHSNRRVKNVIEFSRKLYQYGDPLWLLKNDSVYYVDLPSAKINNYCSSRVPLKFLKSETIKCNVKLTDLEIFHILNAVNESSVISVTENSLNNSALNCTTLHCTNWSIIICDDVTCTNYDTSVHNPLCTEYTCTDLALRVNYIFYYYESKIINATIKLYTQKVSLNIPYMTQEINVMFYMANRSIDQIVELSGNPGYMSNLPIIISSSDGNYTDDFYNNNSKKSKYMPFPANNNGICLISNNKGDFVLFGINKRIKCRYEAPYSALRNGTHTCNIVQNNINELFALNHKLVLSPYGNPHGVKDEDWLSIRMEETEPLSGEFNVQRSELTCYNLITRVSLVLTYADISEVTTKVENKIITARVETTVNNITFNAEDLSTMITFDTVFIDVTKPSLYEYAGGPHLNIHLPKDFFFPFPSNKSHSCKFDICMILLAFITALLKQIK